MKKLTRNVIIMAVVTVIMAVVLGLYIKYTLSLCGQTIRAIEKNDGTKYFKAGEQVTASIRPDDLMVY